MCVTSCVLLLLLLLLLAIAIGASFTNLGEIFNFSVKHEEAKDALSTKLRSVLDVTNSLQISVQTKLKILKEYITFQISFELKTYSFSKTWIEKELDSTANRYNKDWLKLPICAVHMRRRVQVIAKTFVWIRYPILHFHS